MTERLSHVVNTLLVVLPLVNVWSIAKTKNLLVAGRPTPATAAATEEATPAALAYMASLLLILLVGCKVIASLIDWLSAREDQRKKKDITRTCIARTTSTNATEIALHHSIRDSGFFWYLMEFMSLDKIVPTILRYPSVVGRKMRLSRHKRVIRYGQQSALSSSSSSSSQTIEIYLPTTTQQLHQQLQQQQQQHQNGDFRDSRGVNGLVVFIHGGAWGSGGPSSYELMADTFMDINWALAVVGYRVYPEGDASTQTQDVEMAVAEIARRYPTLCKHNVFLFGHSSGAHICMLTIVERARRDQEVARISASSASSSSASALLMDRRRTRVNFDGLIGMSGPYNIDRHFDYEAGRGVEQISPMAPANGYSREMFLRFSPAVQLVDITSQCTSADERQVLRSAIPPITLIHGLKDNTVPHSSTEEAARLLKSTDVVDCKEIYMEDTEHEEAIMQLMLGGPVQEVMKALLLEQ